MLPVRPARSLPLEPVLVVALLVVLALRGPTVYAESAWASDVLLALLALVVGARRAGLAGLTHPLVVLAALQLLASHAVAADAAASWAALAHGTRLVLAGAVGFALGGVTGAPARLARGAAVLGLLAVLHGVVQVVWLHPSLALEFAGQSASFASQLTDGRPNSVFLLPAQLGAFLGAAATLAAGCMLATSGWRRLAAAATLLACVAGVALAASLGGILSLAVGGGALVLLRAPRRVARGLLAGGLLVAVGLAGVSLVRRAGAVRVESPIVARTLNWQTAARLIRERPVLGHGGGSFAWEAQRVRPAAANDARHAHQAFLELAAEHGAALLPLLAALGGALFVAARRSAAEPASAAVGAAALALFAHGFVDFGWSDPAWALPAAGLLGAALAGRRPSASATASAARRRVLGAVTLVLVACVVLEGSVSSVGATRQQAALVLAQAGDHAGAHALLLRARAVAPARSELAALAARASLAEAKGSAMPAELLARAVAEAGEAVRLSPQRAAHRALLATALSASGRTYEAFLSAAAAAAAAPQVEAYRSQRDALAQRLLPRAEPVP